MTRPSIDIQEAICNIEKELKCKEVLCNGKPLHGHITIKFQDGIFQIGEYNVKWK